MSTKATKRIRRDPDVTRTQILNAARQLMIEEGYAAVGSRRIAEAAGVSVTLVYYYFASMDDLFIALYRHNASELDAGLDEPLSRAGPLEAIWRDQLDPARAALGAEFLALANHRKSFKAEIQRYVGTVRDRQADRIGEALTRLEIDGVPCSPLCVATLITGIARSLILEESAGVSVGHDEVRAFVETLLVRLQEKRRLPA